MLKTKMNRKGHLPTIMLFIVAMVLIATAWFTFIGFKKDNQTRVDGVLSVVNQFNSDNFYVPAIFEKIAERAIKDADKNNFKSSFETKFADTADRVSKVSTASGNFFGKVLRKEYDLKEENGIYTLSISKVFIKAEKDKNEMQKEFDLSIKFNKEGIIRNQ